MRIKDIVERGLIMPQTIKPLGLIHLPGKGPNNRFGFRNHSNNRANEGRINWNALRQAKAVMPYLYDSPEARKKGAKPNPNEPNIITSINLKEPVRRGDRLTPLTNMRPVAWQRYMDKAWIGIKQNAAKGDPDAKEKLSQIKQAAADAKMPIVSEEAAGVGIVTKQNATKDVPVGGEYMNIKKLSLGSGKPKTMREEFAEFLENFADGKKKGKSRPGRVKRAGASCKGSVTSLRSKAKKASGERAKMYHWCANMKSGRKK